MSASSGVAESRTSAGRREILDTRKHSLTMLSSRHRMLVGAGAGGLILWLALRGADLAAVSGVISRADPGWLVAGLLSVAATLLAGILRWRLLLAVHDAKPRWIGVTAALIVGQTINILLPIRLGELARAYLICRSEQLPSARVLATIGIEKLGDLVAIGIASATLLAVVTVPGWLGAPGWSLALTGLAAATALGVVAGTGDELIRIARRAASRLSDTWRVRVERHVEHASSGLDGLRSWNGTAGFLLLSGLILLLAASTNYLLFRAFDLALPAAAALLLLIALQVGNTLVSVPGNVGVFQYVTMLILALFSIDRETALAYALVLYAVAIVPKILAGAAIVALGVGDVRIRQADWRLWSSQA